MDFALPKDLEALGERVLTFIKEEIIPFETDPRWTAHGPTEELRRELTERARKAGLLSVHVPKEYGGLGLNHVGKAVVFEAAGYSMLGPVRSEEHTSELQSRENLVCRLLLEKKNEE